LYYGCVTDFGLASCSCKLYTGRSFYRVFENDSFVACIRREFRAFETLVRNKGSQTAREETDYKFQADTGFLYDEASTTAAVLGKIKLTIRILFCPRFLTAGFFREFTPFSCIYVFSH
jgi:hypothetical protein